MTDSIATPAELTDAQIAQVRELAADAARTDGVAALSEASHLALTTPARHLLAHRGATLTGYAQVWPDDSAELVVGPEHRRRGTGSALWHQAIEAGAARVWAHGDLPAAQAFAATHALAPTRSLLKMGRPLSGEDRIPRPLPEGYAVLTFADRVTQTTDPVGELQALNAAAFATHPEQGRLTVADLEARMAESWFDAEGLIYVVDERAPDNGTDRNGSPAPDAGPVAFHWTKIEPAEPQTGEVYVVGVSPAYQGRGLAGPLTDLGLAHLVRRGCTAVELYVDGENAPARATYERAGLRVLTTDQVYSVTQPPIQGRIGI